MRKHKRGMTLVEVVVAIGLFGVVMVTLFPAFLLVNRINNTSKEFTDSSYWAQAEMDYIYSIAEQKTAPEIITDLDVNRSYGCSGNVCSKTVGTFRYEITVVGDDPEPFVASINIAISRVNGTDPGDRSEMTYFVRTKKP